MSLNINLDKNISSGANAPAAASIAAAFGPFALAMLFVAATATMRWAFRPLMGDSSPYLMSYLAVTAAAVWCGLWPAVLAALLSALIGNLLFVRPVYSFSYDAIELVRLTMMLASNLAIAVIGSGARRHREMAELQAAAATRAEKALRQSEATLSAVIDSLPVGLIIAEADGRIVRTNKANQELWGITPETDKWQQYAGWIGYWPETGSRIQAHEWSLARALRTGETVTGDVVEVQQFGTGERRFSLNNAAPVRDPSGKIIAGVVAQLDITERINGERAVRENEGKFRAVFEKAAVGMARVRFSDGRWIDVNEAFCQMLGYSREQLLEINWPDITHRDDVNLDLVPFRQMAAGELERYAVEKRFIHHDGHVVWAQLTLSLVRDAGGNPDYEIAIIEDIGVRKRAEEALRESEMRFRTLADNMSQLAWMADKDGATSWYNRRWYEYTGTTLAQMEGWGWRQVHHPDYLERVVDKFRRHLASGTVWEDTFPLRGKDGQYRWFLSRAVPIHDQQGNVIRWFGTNTDITDLRQAQQAQSTLAAVVQSSADAIISESLEGKILSWNSAAERLFGYTVDEAIGQPVSMLIPEASLPMPSDIDLVARGGNVHRQEAQRVRKDGKRVTVWLSISPIHDSEGRLVGVAKIAHDITELKQAQEKLLEATRVAQSAKAAAEEASRAKDHFLAVLSHELRTPLTPVTAALSIMADDARLPSDLREELSMVQRNVELETRLIDDLLDLTRVSRGKITLDKRPLVLCKLLEHVADICSTDIEARGIHFGLQLRDCPVVVEGDSARLQQVFWNVLKNAVKFTPAGGCIGMSVRRENGHAIADISDSGRGIDPKLLPHIFNAFEQGSQEITRQFGGLGLGLAICKAMIDLHGGSISAHSEGLGKGATFRIQVPIAKGATLAPTADTSPGLTTGAAKGSARNKLRVLLVEDHGDTLRVMARFLGARGHQVTTAGDVATALTTASTQPFDVLVSDLGLPDRSGLDLVQQLRKEGNNVPAIALSGYGQEEDLRRSRAAGFTEHLVKPVDIRRLQETIERTVSAQRRN